jgi:hypothetical protein
LGKRARETWQPQATRPGGSTKQPDNEPRARRAPTTERGMQGNGLKKFFEKKIKTEVSLKKNQNPRKSKF